MAHEVNHEQGDRTSAPGSEVSGDLAKDQSRDASMPSEVKPVFLGELREALALLVFLPFILLPERAQDVILGVINFPAEVIGSIKDCILDLLQIDDRN